MRSSERFASSLIVAPPAVFPHNELFLARGTQPGVPCKCQPLRVPVSIGLAYLSHVDPNVGLLQASRPGGCGMMQAWSDTAEAFPPSPNSRSVGRPFVTVFNLCLRWTSAMLRPLSTCLGVILDRGHIVWMYPYSSFLALTIGIVQLQAANFDSIYISTL